MAWAPDYIDLDVLRDALRILDNEDDAELTLAISSASRAIDHGSNRQFGQVDASETRTYRDIRWSPTKGVYVVRVDDIHDATGAVVVTGGVATTAFELHPDDNPAKGRPYEELWMRSVSAEPDAMSRRAAVSITSDSFGWATIPPTIVEAALVQGIRFFKRKDAPFGVAGSPEVGSEVRLLDKMDPDVAMMVRSFRRDWPMQ